MAAPARPPSRLEDPPLLRGAVRFLADLDLPDGTLHAHFVRSDVASGRLVSLDLDAARAAPGVHAVLDATTLGVAPYRHFTELADMAQEPLVSGAVRHVGEAVALILADSVAAAADAADLVVAELDPLPVVVDPGGALDAAALHANVGSNLVYELDPDAGEDPLAGAHQVVEVVVENQRVASAPLENDGILAVPGRAAAGGGTATAHPRLDVWCTAQGVHPLRDELARGLGVDPSTIRVRAAAVGGGFGGRASLQVDFLAVAAAAIQLGRPVRWIAARGENLTGMPHGRGYRTLVRLGLDADGRPIGLDCDALVDAGSVAHMNALLMVSARRQAVGLYRIDRLRWRGRAVLTNTTPVGAYRGAGQPEANHARERVLDVAARRLGSDPIEYRLEHLLGAEELPRTQPGGVDYDSADPRRALERAVEVAGVERWRVEQARRRAARDPRRIGIGVGCYAQTSGRGQPVDAARVEVDGEGRVTIYSGSASHGQGHRSTLAGLVADRLGVDAALVALVDADTDAVADALSTGGSRASQVLASV
ncbi:MAG: xanthine dehydrogenase family protein molybdopterin-binding subunit, partial [Acidimicrobiia bacterium]|nr:xanthine dehydrogenase family protein molybdopterin-binding subunit [Acidimicrobiia bacterium]